ncbi:hypothetical protein TRFO_40545 [Tritrichomonas foetus]|uniref:Uncharacterized protein n=1 Tax=Tritrichomonas foetus TaxID=1144522 RepID=A0A1J4J652_9EUKA|nr:hypothetical protein TRFO_40545 [Tritrichomonas foetus]|eukprot:OHS93139.1 hypothetical protein TRFO_40545 [Tritrichomonas foetus]
MRILIRIMNRPQQNKSQVFTSLVILQNGQPPNKIITYMLKQRDAFYENHFSIQAENANDYVKKITRQGSTKEHGAAIACALLTIRNQDFLEEFFDFVYSQCSGLIDCIALNLCDSVRKSFEVFSPSASSNTQNLFTCMCENDTYMPLVRGLSIPLISAIDNGCLTQQNFKLVQFFMNNFQNYQHVWGKLENAITFLTIKLLRFYQDVFVFSDQSFNESDRTNLAFIQNMNSKCTNFGNSLVNLFQMGINTGSIAKYALKEVVRILYDPRTYHKMSNKYPHIYNMINLIPDNSAFFTHISIIQVMLPYQKLCELIGYGQTYTKHDAPFPSVLTRYNSKLIDYDLILGDVIRTFLQSADYEKFTPEQRSECIFTLLQKGLEKGIKLNSALFALISDFFFFNPNLYSSDKEYQKRINFLVMPAIFIIGDQRKSQIASEIIEILFTRLRHPDFGSAKRTSVRELLKYVQKRVNQKFFETIDKLPTLKDEVKKEFSAFIESRDNDIVPQKISAFSRSNTPLDTQAGTEIIKLAQEKISSLYMLNGQKWQPTLPNVLKIFDTLVPSSRKGIDLVLNLIDLHATVPCMGRNFNDATIMLKWIFPQRKIYRLFNEALEIVDLKFYGEALAHLLLNDQYEHDYKELLLDCPVLGRNSIIIKAICDYCPTSTILELADLPFFNLDKSSFLYILANCATWSNDSQIKLTNLLSGKFVAPSDFLFFSDFLVSELDNLPLIVFMYFQNILKMKVHVDFANILEKIQKSNAKRANEFCQPIRESWNSKKSTITPSTRPILSDEAMI